MVRKFNYYGIQSSVRKKKKKTRSYRPRSIIPHKTSRRFWKNYTEDLGQEDEEEMENLFQEEYYIDDESFYYYNYYSLPLPSITRCRNNFFSTGYLFPPSPSLKQQMIRDIRSSNLSILRKSYKNIDINRIFQINRRCLLCQTVDEDILIYLIQTEHIKRCHYCRLSKEKYTDFQNRQSSPSYPLPYQKLIDIKNLYKNHCALCCSTEYTIHRFLIKDHHIKYCRKYDCLGYDEYVYQHFELKNILSHYYNDDHNLYIHLNGNVLNDVVSTIKNLRPDCFYELLDFL